ncbi:hypothetical protein EK0264_04215 [Epidermidibacterium keratini]|uniref:MarR family transcriptional regulator n=1 Tax=Epidermidibacterium keratini TaxID=1891644 RepID=A0A7L4YLZ1_9ACTN|nr:hypothetical protein [Epidermidibacterium keratini]QHB99566.1 hypothetical protein EK0264_04215 [Epidermidibacterium keratini]
MNSRTKSELVGQPIGYWAGEAYRLISDRLIRSLAEAGLTQPQWWVLGRVASGSRSWSIEQLVDELQPYSDNEEGRDVGDEIADLIERNAVRESGGILVITERGAALLATAQANNGSAHSEMRADLTDDEYAATIEGLTKVVGILRGDSRDGAGA